MNKIKKFYAHNKGLSLLGLLSLIISISYIVSIDWPEWYNGLGNIFEFVYNLCLAYLGSLIFYIIQVYIPDVKRKKEIRRKLFRYLGSIDCEIFSLSGSIETLEICLKFSYNYEEFMMLSNKCLLENEPPNTKNDFDELYLYNIKSSLYYLDSSVSTIDNLINVIYFTDINGSTDLEVIDSKVYDWIEAYKSLKNKRVMYLDGNEQSKLNFYKCMYSYLIKLYDIYSKEQIHTEVTMN